MSKKGVSIERAIELEIWLLENCSIGMNKEELLSLLASKDFNQKEIDYLISAYYMPIADIRKKIAIYDNACPHIDESEFISILMIKYIYDENIVIKRIRNIRAIDKYLDKNPNIVFSNIQIYNKLVRDNIPNIIESNGEKAVYHVLNDEEYLNYLLKKDSEKLEELRQVNSKEKVKEKLCDKLEIIRAMANFCGFTLEDIIEEANIKRESKGSFEKRLVLERTYKYSKKDA